MVIDLCVVSLSRQTKLSSLDSKVMVVTYSYFLHLFIIETPGKCLHFTGSLPPHSFSISLRPSRQSPTDLGGSLLGRPAVLPVEETTYSAALSLSSRVRSFSVRCRSSAISSSQSSKS